VANSIEQWGKMVRRTFRSLFSDTQFYLSKAELAFEKVHSQDTSHPEKLNMKLWEEEKAYSRACFIFGVAAIEAFCNALIEEYRIHKLDELPSEWTNHKQKQNALDWWKLEWKVQFIPTICNEELKHPAEYINPDCREMKLFSLHVKVRDSIMHGRIHEPHIRLRRDEKGVWNLDDDLPENFWPKSDIPKDFTSFNYECAKLAYDNIMWVRDKLIECLGLRITRGFLNQDVIEVDGRKYGLIRPN